MDPGASTAGLLVLLLLLLRSAKSRPTATTSWLDGLLPEPPGSQDKFPPTPSKSLTETAE